jgi:hypothetical protein
MVVWIGSVVAVVGSVVLEEFSVPTVDEVVSSAVVVVSGAAVVVVVGAAVVVVGATVVVVGGSVVVVGAAVVVVAPSTVVVVGPSVVVVVGPSVVVVVGPAVVVVVGATVVVVVGATVVVVVVGATVVVVVVGAAVVVVVPATTGMVMTVVVGIAHVAVACKTLDNTRLVVSWNAFSVTLPDAGAVACTVMSGVVNVPGGNGPGVPIEILSVAVNTADSVRVCVAPPAVGASVAVPGFTIVPGLKWVPLIWYTNDKFEYWLTGSEFAVLGNVDEPPGIVTVNVEPGATVSGAVIVTEMSCFCVWVAPFTTALHVTPVKAFVTVCAPAMPASATLNVAIAIVPRPAYTPRRRFQLSFTLHPPESDRKLPTRWRMNANEARMSRDDKAVSHPCDPSPSWPPLAGAQRPN